MSRTERDNTILVVDDDPDLADLVTLQLQQEYTVRTAYGGEDALEMIDNDIDVVVLDRRMPTMSGDTVLTTIRDRGLDCRVIMITAVSPDYDILDMPFNDYLCKPIARETLLTAIDQQLQTRNDDTISAYFDLIAKQSLLEQTKPPSELEDHEEYQKLTAQAELLREEIDAYPVEFDTMVTAFTDINRT